jgi:hypothetical protein
MDVHAISGDWTELTPRLRVRLQDAPNEEDMGHYDPQGVVILQVQALTAPGPYCKKEGFHGPHDTAHGFDCPGLQWV